MAGGVVGEELTDEFLARSGGFPERKGAAVVRVNDDGLHPERIMNLARNAIRL